MKNKLYIYITSLLLILSSYAYGQQLGFDTIGPSINYYPDTVNLNDVYTHQISVTNYGSTPLNGTIYLVAGIDSSGTIVSVDTVGSVVVTNFGQNDTIGIGYTETYDVINGYKLGVNIVVVWPVSSVGTTIDTLRKQIFIKDYISVHPVIGDNNQVLIYPNPSNDYFSILVEDDIIDRVKIIDLNGKLIYDKAFTSKIDISNFNSGIYFVKLVSPSGFEKIKKLIK